MVASAGTGESVQYPAKYKEVMAVGGVDCRGERVKGEAYGKEIEVVCPAKDVCTLGWLDMMETSTGSSMAAPQVVGLASLLWQKDLSKSSRFIRQLINATAKSLGKKEVYGNGVIDCDYALKSYQDFIPVYEEGTEIEENQEYVSVYDEDMVTGCWTKNEHFNAVKRAKEKIDDYYKCLKEGARWQDIEESGLYGMKANPGFHGFYRDNYNKQNNYFLSVIHLMRQAISFISNGKASNELLVNGKGVSVTKKKFIDKIKKAWKKNEGTRANKNTLKKLEDSSKKMDPYYKAAFVFGMAIHSATDIFAHSAWMIHKKANETDALWQKLDHPATDSSDSSNKKWYADNPKRGYKRYDLAKRVAKNMIGKLSTTTKKKKTYLKIADVNAGVNDLLTLSSKDYIEWTSKNPSDGEKRQYAKKDFIGLNKFVTYLKESDASASLLKQAIYLDQTAIYKKISPDVDVRLQTSPDFDKQYKLKGVSYNNKSLPIEKVGLYQNTTEVIFLLTLTQIKDGKDIKRFIKVKVNRPENELKEDKKKLEKKTQTQKVKNQIEKLDKQIDHDKRIILPTQKFVIHDSDLKTLADLGKTNKVKAQSKDGGNIPQALFVIHKISDEIEDLSLVSNEKGECEIPALEEGAYQVTVSKEGYQSTTEKVVIDDTTEELQSIIMEKVGPENTPVPQVGANVVIGKVIPPDGDSYLGHHTSGITLKIYHALDGINGPVVKTVVVDEKGEYRIDGLEPGDYLVKTVDNRDVPIPYGMSVEVIRIREGMGICEQNIKVYPENSEDIIRIVLKWNQPNINLNPYIDGMIEGDWLNKCYYSYYYYLCHQNALTRTGVLFVDTPKGQKSQDNPQSVTIYFCKHQKFRYYVESEKDQMDVLQKAGLSVEVYRYQVPVPLKVYYPKEGSGNRWTVFDYSGEKDQFSEVNEISKEE